MRLASAPYCSFDMNMVVTELLGATPLRYGCAVPGKLPAPAAALRPFSPEPLPTAVPLAASGGNVGCCLKGNENDL